MADNATADASAVRVLIIDDDELDRMALARAVSCFEPHAECLSAASADEGLRLLEHEGCFDLIIVDYSMPGTDGLSVIRSMKLLPELAFTPIVMVTGHDDPALGASAILEGADAYLGKEEMSESRFAWAVASAQERARMREQAHEKDVALRNFAFHAAHDLKTPLNGIAGYSRLLSLTMENLPEAAKEYTDHIYQQSMKMAELVDAMLDYAVAGETLGEVRAVTVSDMVASARGWCAPTIEAEGARLELDADASIHCDRAQIERVLQNLILNALKYRSAAAPHIIVSAACRDDLVTVSVQDNGLGVPAGNAERLFEPMQRAHVTAADGYGLGLSIARKIVASHGGRIWCEPRGDGGGENGSVFAFTLPVGGPLK